jgi:hypothetical protein
MKRQLLSVIAILLTAPCLYAQTAQIESEKWADKPAIHPVDNKYNKESAVVLFDKRRVEFVDEPKQEIAAFYTLHKIVHINDDRGIEEFNKIYLGVSENSDIISIKARTILPGGKIIEIDKNNIKDIKESDGNTYKIFAMEGLEKGCEVEYFYTSKRSASFFGREILQGSNPVIDSKFELVGPERLRFEIKPYNFAVPVIDTVLSKKRISQLSFSNIPGAEEEKYSSGTANLKRIEFKLSYNDAIKKGERVFTWNELARRVYALYTFNTEKENQQVLKLVTQNGWANLSDEPAKIIAVENYVKTHFSYNEEAKSDDANKVENVLKNKAAGTIGIMRLYNLVLKNLALNYQFVLTGDRNKFFIDKEFENWNNCDYPLVYFPAENKFIAPTRPDFRYPWISPVWGDANGLFCKSTSLGTLSTAIADVRPINLEDYQKSYDNIESRLELSKDLDTLNVDAKQSYAGYIAVNYRDAFNFSNDEQKRKIIKDLAKMVSNSENLVFSEITDPEFEKGTTNVPLVLHTKTKSGELVERAGNKLLIKIGLAIGLQVEMYQDKPRQTPVFIEYGHIEERKINFVIPDGYVVSNLNDLKIDQTYKENGELTMGFVSGYELQGKVLSIHIMEEYRKTYYPISQFEQFRKIINASSDFNKVVLVLQKKA